MNCISNLYIVITAGVGLVGCLEVFAPHCYVLVTMLGVPVYLSLVCFNSIFWLWHKWVKVPCSVVQNQSAGRRWFFLEGTDAWVNVKCFECLEIPYSECVFIVMKFAICNYIISTIFFYFMYIYIFFFFNFLLLFVVICQSLCHTVPSGKCHGRYALLNPMKYKVEWILLKSVLWALLKAATTALLHTSCP